MADAIAEAVQADLATKADPLATRTDLRGEIQSVRTDLGREIQSVRADLRETGLRLEARIEAVKSDLVKWVVGMIGFQTVVPIGAAVALARVLAK